MCGRFTYWDTSHITSTYHCYSEIEIDTHYNACPGQHIPVIVADLQEDRQVARSIELMRWGLIPDWANIDQHKGFINARSETITEKKSFKENFKLRRCIIPAMGYYEWDSNKQPYFISNQDKQICFAGIWDGGNAGIYPSVAILTIQAHALQYIHERCPLVLCNKDTISLWLNPMTPQDVLLSLIQGATDDGLISHKVDKKVGNPRINDSSLIEKLFSENP